MQKQPHTEQDRKRQDAISELHRRNRDEAAWVQRRWDRLPPRGAGRPRQGDDRQGPRPVAPGAW